MLLDSGTAGLAPLAEMALMFASRAQHIAEVIEPGWRRARLCCATGLPIRRKLIREVAGGWEVMRCGSCIGCCAGICSRI